MRHPAAGAALYSTAPARDADAQDAALHRGARGHAGDCAGARGAAHRALLGRADPTVRHERSASGSDEFRGLVVPGRAGISLFRGIDGDDAGFRAGRPCLHGVRAGGHRAGPDRRQAEGGADRRAARRPGSHVDLRAGAADPDPSQRRATRQHRRQRRIPGHRDGALHASHGARWPAGRHVQSWRPAAGAGQRHRVGGIGTVRIPAKPGTPGESLPARHAACAT